MELKMFEIKNVSKRFLEEYALKNISINIGKGMNFIIGASGSGKTTLLKIMSGMDQEFEGEVFYCGQKVKELSEEEKSIYYNNIFGFVWQDFNLLEDRTVLENVMLPQYLKPQQDKKTAMKLLHELKISELWKQKVSKLSGGQKQRVAIARELMKNPQVIFADEPTSALDSKAAKTILEVLRDISKNRTVIVVTHDTSLIDKNSKVYEFDKGEIVTAFDLPAMKSTEPEQEKKCKLSFVNSLRLSLESMKNSWGRVFCTVLSLLIAAVLLLVTVSGAILDSGQAAFQELFDTYGEGILDVSVVGSFISAGGSDGKEKNEPNANVEQDINGLYDKYRLDERISHIVFTQAYTDIQLMVDGKSYKIETSNSVPTVNQLLVGTMPMGEEYEIVIPKSFLEKMGIPKEETLGKTVDFKGSVYNWDSGEAVAMPVQINAKIVGVVDTTVKYETKGQIIEYSVDDSFFFSKAALDEMRTQAKIKSGEGNFTIRAKTPADMIALKDELNAQGIVPLGRFELVEDMVRLNDQTTKQSGSAIFIIGILAIVVVLAAALVTALMRKREYAIFKVSGYANRHLWQTTFSEFLSFAIGSAILFLCISPLISLVTNGLWEVDILNAKLLLTGVVLLFGMAFLSFFVSVATAVKGKVSSALQKGDF